MRNLTPVLCNRSSNAKRLIFVPPVADLVFFEHVDDGDLPSTFCEAERRLTAGQAGAGDDDLVSHLPATFLHIS